MSSKESPPGRTAYTAYTARTLATILAALTALTALAPPAAASDSVAPRAEATPTAIDAVVREFREATGLPGAAVTVTHGTEVVHAAGYGEVPSGAAVTARTPMAVASVSKSFTSLAVLQLVEAGELALDDPVQDRLPEFTMADPRAADITVRQLLDQTSGMSDSTFPAFSRAQPHSLRALVAGLRNAKLAAAPGTHWEYHNPNYQVAARLVEVVSGEPFAGYLNGHVLGPLGMDDSRAINHARELPPSARGHIGLLGFAVPAPEPALFGGGSGGVLSSARDMAAWLIAQNNGGRGPGGERIVSADGITQMRTPSAESGSYALGWTVETTATGAPLVQHSGDLFTSTAYQALLPESGYGIAVMANTGVTTGDASALASALIALVEGSDVPAPPDRATLIALDAVFLALAAAVATASVRGVVRSRRWAVRRFRLPVWRTALRLAPLFLPLLLLGSVHRVVGVLYRGKDVAWIQVAYLYPAFMVLLGVAALGCAAVALTRIAQKARKAEAQPS